MNSLKKKNLKDMAPVFQKDDRYPPVKSLIENMNINEGIVQK